MNKFVRLKRIFGMKLIKRLLIGCRNLFFFLFLSSLLIVVIYRFIPVYVTPLMVIRCVEQVKDGKPWKLEHSWVPIEKISQSLPQAVVSSEDNRFLEHRGFDIEQIQKARKEAQRGKRLRGASTISQQTAKNVFLWPGRSYLRKGLEAYFTLLIEYVWGKERIMEVYLNSIEMGDGIYGAQAVSHAHFKKEAYQLTDKEAALIAASLPNPIRFNSAKPSPYVLRRQGQILSLMAKILPVDMGYRVKKQEFNPKRLNNKKKWRASSIKTSVE